MLKSPILFSSIFPSGDLPLEESRWDSTAQWFPKLLTILSSFALVNPGLDTREVSFTE